MTDPKEKPSSDTELTKKLLEKAQDLHTQTGADVLLVVHTRDVDSPAYAYASPKLMPMLTQGQKLSTITQLLNTKENSSVPVVQLFEGPAVIDLNEDHNTSQNSSLNTTVQLQQASDPQFCSPVQSVYHVPANSNPVIVTESISPLHSQVYPATNQYSSPVIQSPLVNRHLIHVGVHSSPMQLVNNNNNNNHMYARFGQQNSSSPQLNTSTENSSANTSANTIHLQSTRVLAGSLPSTPPFSLTSSPSSNGSSSTIALEVNMKFLHAFKSVHKLHLTPEEKTQVINLICANNQILLAAFEAFSTQSEEDIKYLTQASKNLINNQCAL